MADYIKGITLSIGGDISGLDSALKSVNKNINATQAELKKVDRALKLDPKNTEMVAQKQKLLANNTADLGAKLDSLKQVQQQANEAIIGGADISEEAMRELAREILTTKDALKKTQAEAEKLAKSLEEAPKDAAKAFKEFGDNATKAGKAMAPLSAGATAVAGGFAAAAVSTREYRQDLSKLKTNVEVAGASLSDVKDRLRDLNAITGESDSNIEALSNLLKAGLKGNELQKAVDALSGAVIQFPDTLKIESLSDSLQETLATGKATGQFEELLERLGYNLDSFNSGLERASRNGQEQKYIMSTLAKTGLAEVNRRYRENNAALIESANAQFDMNEAWAELGEIAEPIISKVMQVAADLLGKIAGVVGSLDDNTISLLATILLITAALSPVLLAIGGVSAGISGIMGLGEKLGPMIKTLTSDVGLLGKAFSFIAANPIAAVVAALALLLLTNKDFRDGVLEIFDGLMDFFKGVGDFFVELFTKKIPEALKKMKDFFVGIWNSLIEIVKAPINVIIEFLNLAIGGINSLIEGLNSIKIDVPDWIPFLGGKTFGFNIGTIPEIPLLAKGGIVSSGRAIVGEKGPELMEVRGGRAIVKPLGRQGHAATVTGTTVINNNTFKVDDIGTYIKIQRMLESERQSYRMGYIG